MVWNNSVTIEFVNFSPCEPLASLSVLAVPNENYILFLASSYTDASSLAISTSACQSKQL